MKGERKFVRTRFFTGKGRRLHKRSALAALLLKKIPPRTMAERGAGEFQKGQSRKVLFNTSTISEKQPSARVKARALSDPRSCVFFAFACSLLPFTDSRASVNDNCYKACPVGGGVFIARFPKGFRLNNPYSKGASETCFTMESSYEQSKQSHPHY